MATLGGTHQQRSTQRQFNYWVAYEAVGNMMAYSAIVKEGDQPLDMPDARFWFNARECDAEQTVRVHLLNYLDTTTFSDSPMPVRAPRRASAPGPR